MTRTWRSTSQSFCSVLVRTPPFATRPESLRRRTHASGDWKTPPILWHNISAEADRHDHHHLRHQELRYHEEGARLAGQAGRGLRLPRLQGRGYRPRAAGALEQEGRLGDIAQP